MVAVPTHGVEQSLIGIILNLYVTISLLHFLKITQMRRGKFIFRQTNGIGTLASFYKNDMKFVITRLPISIVAILNKEIQLAEQTFFREIDFRIQYYFNEIYPFFREINTKLKTLKYLRFKVHTVEITEFYCHGFFSKISSN